jgi:hypothetical protein
MDSAGKLTSERMISLCASSREPSERVTSPVDGTLDRKLPSNTRGSRGDKMSLKCSKNIARSLMLRLVCLFARPPKRRENDSEAGLLAMLYVAAFIFAKVKSGE